jgi:aminoglycoside phosphotransferase (APT) family kinase protein
MATRRPGALVARGNTSDIVEWGPGLVAKVLRRGIPPDWAAVEALTTRLVHAAGLPAPTVHDVVTVHGRPAIVLERVPGPSLWDRMQASPAQLPALVKVLVNLQADLLGSVAPTGLAPVVDRLRRRIRGETLLRPAERAALERTAACAADGSAMCHFDLHPANILMGRHGPVVIDWFDAGAGHPAADVARTSVLVHPATAVGQLRKGSTRFLREVHRTYTGMAPSAVGAGEEDLERWDVLVLAGRLSEPLPHHVRRSTARVLRRRPAIGTVTGTFTPG